ncbi:H-NS histone family protein [Stenotrophomonas rhizophila]
MTKPTLDSILSAKQKLEDELQALDAQEAQLRQEQTSDAHAEIVSLISQYAKNFNAKQRAEISSSLAVSTGQPRKSAGPKKAVAAKYWLPHTQETWSGRGRTPRPFAAWEGTAAYKEWKSNHPDEKFPAYPG